MDDDVVADFYGRAVLRSRNTMNTMISLFVLLFVPTCIYITNFKRSTRKEVKPKTSGVVLSGSVNKNLLLSRQHDRVA